MGLSKDCTCLEDEPRTWASCIEHNPDVLMPFDPEWTGRAPTTIYAVKYQATETSGKNRTYVFLLGSKDAYDKRIAGKERGQGLKGTVTWEAITPAIKKNKPLQEERLFD